MSKADTDPKVCPSCGRTVRFDQIVEVDESRPQADGELKREKTTRCVHCLGGEERPAETISA